jgi:hypothetical protein
MRVFDISNTSTIACNMYFFSEKLPQNLQKVIHGDGDSNPPNMTAKMRANADKRWYTNKILEGSKPYFNETVHMTRFWN